MKIYNQGKRAIIIDPKYVIKGGRFLDTDREKKRVYIDPKAKIDVTDDYSKKLLSMYPKELMNLSEFAESPVKKEVKKKIKKTVKKPIKTSKKR